MKQTSQDPDSLEDVESSMMDCDPQERLDLSEEKLFKVSLTYLPFITKFNLLDELSLK